jgi:fucose permease
LSVFNFMKNKNVIVKVLPILFGFFIMGFVDIVGITSDYVQKTFNWSHVLTGFVPFMVFIWFLFLGIPIGNQMNKWGRKNTVLISLIATIVGMMLPLIAYNSFTCLIAYALLGIGNAILQVSLNPLLSNVITDSKFLTSSLTSGQVIKAISSLCGPEFVLLAISLFGENKWYYCFPILGFVTLLSALWLLLTPIEKENISLKTSQISYKSTLMLLKNKNILLLFLGIFFVVAVDVATNYTSSKIMEFRFHWPLSQAKFAPQIYFLCRTVGALIGVFFLSRINEIKYFKINIIACIVSILILIFFKNELLNLCCIGAIGFFASSIFPIIFSVALQSLPEKANEISGLIITAVAGGGIITPIIGFAISEFGIIGGIVVILACAFYLAFCSFSLNNVEGNNPKKLEPSL